MKVVQIQRKRPPERFSIEGYFDRVRQCLAGKTKVSAYVLPCMSRGVFRRIWNMVSVIFHQADVNHVTGDIHYVAVLLKRSRTLLTVHDCEVLNRLTGWRRWVVKVLWYQLPAKRITAMTVNSNETKRSLLEVVRFPEDRIHVVPVSVSPLYQPCPKQFFAERPRILQIGTKANKNIIRLAEALDGISCELHIVGPLEKQQEATLRRHNVAVINHLYLTDEQLVEQYKQADIVSFVSTHEGFGMPIVEAQSVERVCVTSSCSSMPEVAGAGACFVDPFDVQSIREGFQRVVTDVPYRQSVIAAGRQNKLRFDSQRIADDFLQIYKSICNQSTED